MKENIRYIKAFLLLVIALILALTLCSFCPKSAKADVMYLYPMKDTIESDFTMGICTPHYDCVDDPHGSPDDAETELSSTTLNDQDRWKLQDCGAAIYGASIDTVRIMFRAKVGNMPPPLSQIAMRIYICHPDSGCEFGSGTGKNPLSYTTYSDATTLPGSRTWNINDTANVSMIDSLMLEALHSAGGEDVWITSAYLAIYYTSQYIRSGKVVDKDTDAVVGCTVIVYNGTEDTVLTDASGDYSFLIDGNDTCIIKPHQNDLIFNPESTIYYNVIADDTGENYIIDGAEWADTNYNRRKPITFGTDHSKLPSGYTVKLDMVTGRHILIAENGLLNETIGANQALTYQSNDDIWGTYYATEGGKGQIWVYKYDAGTETWGTPYRVIHLTDATDGHHVASIFADNLDTLHLAFRCHNSQLQYKKSKNTDPTDSADWTGVATPSGADFATYPRFGQDDQDSLYLFFRQKDTSFTPGNNPRLQGYIRSADYGSSWGSFDTVWKVDVWAEAVNTSAYATGAIIKDNRIHWGITPLTGYSSYPQIARGMGYIYGDIDSASGSISWYKVDGTSVTAPVNWDSTDNVLAPVAGNIDCGTNQPFLDVNISGYPYLEYHCPEDGVYMGVRLLRWNGSSWVTENLSTSVTPNRYFWWGISSPIVDPVDNFVYMYAGIAGILLTDTSQSGGTDSTIVLGADNSSIDDYYNGLYVRLKEGTGAANWQMREIIDYVGASKIAYVYPDWDTTADSATIYCISPRWFGGEVGLWIYDGISWSFRFITEHSSKGIPLFATVPGYMGNENASTAIGRYKETVYGWNIDPTYNRPDGEDIRIYYMNQEVHRIANYWNFDNTEIQFQLQDTITEDKASPVASYYYVYYDCDNCTNARDNPDSVYLFFEGWEMFDKDEQINGKNSWTAGNGKVINWLSTGDDWTKVIGGDKSYRAYVGLASKNVGTNLTDVELEAYFNNQVGAQKMYYGLANGTDTFKVGFVGGIDDYIMFFNGAWSNSSVDNYSAHYFKINMIVRSDSGCWAYADDDLVCANLMDDTLQEFDDLIIGGGVSGDTLRAYYDQIIIKRWVPNEAELSLGSEEVRTGYSASAVHRRRR